MCHNFSLSNKVTVKEVPVGFAPDNTKFTVEIKPEPKAEIKTEQLKISELPGSKEISIVNKTTEQAALAIDKAGESDILICLFNPMDTKCVENVAKASVLGSANVTAKKLISAGTAGVPIDLLLNSFDYHRGKTDAKTYTAQSLNGFGGWASFEAGMLTTAAVAKTITGKNLSTFGKVSIGVGVGIIACSLYNKTVGKDVEAALVKVIPESMAKPVAQKIDKYFAAPVDTYIIQPIKNNPKTSIAIGAVAITALTLRFPTAFGKNILLGFASSSAIGAGGNYLIDKTFEVNTTIPVTYMVNNKLSSKKASLEKVKKAEVTFPSLNTPITKAEKIFAKNLEKRFNSPEKDKITDTEVLKYNNIAERIEQMQKKLNK